MEHLLLAFTDKNIRKLLKHLPVQLKPEQIGRGIKAHPDMPMRHKKALAKALKMRKGVRIQFTPQELVQGSGFWDWLKGAAQTVWEKGIKPVASVVGKIAKPVYEIAKPLIRPALKAALPAIGTALGGPAGAALGSTLAPQVLDVVGDTTKAFGVRGRGLKTNKNRAVSDMSGIQDTSSNLLSTQHPIFQTNQQMPAQDVYGAMQQMQSMRGSGLVVSQSPKDYLALQHDILAKPDYTYGGSFKSSGYGRRPVGGSFVPAGYSYRRGGAVKFLK